MPSSKMSRPVTYEVSSEYDSIYTTSEEMMVICKLKVEESKTKKVKKSDGIDFLMVLDTSRSMSDINFLGESRISSIREALAGLVGLFEEHDRFALIGFDNEGYIMIDLDYATPENKIEWKKWLEDPENIECGGKTNLGAGVFEALDELGGSESQRFASIVVVCDGHVNAGECDADKLAEKIEDRFFDREAKTFLNVVGIGNDYDEYFLDTLAALCGDHSRSLVGVEDETELAQATLLLIKEEATQVIDMPKITLTVKACNGVFIESVGPQSEDEFCHFKPKTRVKGKELVFEFARFEQDVNHNLIFSVTLDDVETETKHFPVLEFEWKFPNGSTQVGSVQAPDATTFSIPRKKKTERRRKMRNEKVTREIRNEEIRMGLGRDFQSLRNEFMESSAQSVSDMQKKVLTKLASLSSNLEQKRSTMSEFEFNQFDQVLEAAKKSFGIDPNFLSKQKITSYLKSFAVTFFNKVPIPQTLAFSSQELSMRLIEKVEILKTSITKQQSKVLALLKELNVIRPGIVGKAKERLRQQHNKPASTTKRASTRMINGIAASAIALFETKASSKVSTEPESLMETPEQRPRSRTRTESTASDKQNHMETASARSSRSQGLKFDSIPILGTILTWISVMWKS